MYIVLFYSVMFNYDYVKIHINMPIKKQTFSETGNFIKIKQNKMINVYFQLQELSSYK